MWRLVPFQSIVPSSKDWVRLVKGNGCASENKGPTLKKCVSQQTKDWSCTAAFIFKSQWWDGWGGGEETEWKIQTMCKAIAFVISVFIEPFFLRPRKNEHKGYYFLSFRSTSSCFCRTIHYPPETTNILLLCRMIATVKQVTVLDLTSVAVLLCSLSRVLCHDTMHQRVFRKNHGKPQSGGIRIGSAVSVHFTTEFLAFPLGWREFQDLTFLLLQAENPEQVISTFNKFCKVMINDEEEIAHKLLGKQFQVTAFVI